MKNACESFICAEILRAGGWLPFDDYLRIAMSHPQYGYYGSGRVRFGDKGDFHTAPTLSPLFGETLAAQMMPVLKTVGGGVLELGGGSGALAEQLLASLPPNTPYYILETSTPLMQRQRHRLRDFSGVRWLDSLPHAHTGIIVANEVLDCVPFRLFVKNSGKWHERGVGCVDGKLVWAERMPTDDIWRRLLEFSLADGYQAEISPQAEALTATLVKVLTKGCLLFADYGFGRQEYYHPQRAEGTMLCHRDHRTDSHPLIDAGDKDITAHVDFTAIAAAAAASGGELAGYSTQAGFLLGGGILDLLQRHINDTVTYVRHAASVNKLLAPQEMGEFFKFIAFCRDAPPPSAFAFADIRHRL